MARFFPELGPSSPMSCPDPRTQGLAGLPAVPLVVPPLVVIGQAQEGRPQPDHDRRQQDHEDQHQGRVQVHEPHVEDLGRVGCHHALVAHAEAQRRQPEPDQGTRGDDRRTECSHRQFLSVRGSRKFGRIRATRLHVARAEQAAEDQQDPGQDDEDAATTAAGIGAIELPGEYQLPPPIGPPGPMLM